MKNLTTRSFGAVEIINLIGIALAVFAFVFGPWLGSRSAAWVLVDLGRFLTGPDLPADVSRQQSIFAILVLLVVLVAGLAVAFYAGWRTSNRRWAAAEVLVAVMALILLGILFFRYQARTAGLLLTVLGCLVAGGGALGVHYRLLREAYPERTEALAALEQAWAGTIAEAEANKTPLSVLALTTSQPLRPEVFALVDEELRARDIAFPTQEGVFALLWEANPEGAMVVARNLQEILSEAGHGQSWVGLASFPEDGDRMGVLLARAQAALDMACASAEPAIVPYRYPERSDARRRIERAWEPTLAEARAGNIPLATLALATSRSLTASEVALIDDELRIRDLILPVRDGLFVLLWKVNLHNATVVAGHLQDILASQLNVDSHVGIAWYPEDGDQIGVLLQRAEQALEVARRSTEQSVVAYQDS